MMRQISLLSIVNVWVAAALLSACSLLPNPFATSPSAGGKTNPQVSGANGVSRDWQMYRKQAAARIMQANLASTYDGRPADVLASIPVLSIHLNADGSVRSIDVMRTPKAYPQTIAMAKAAIMRAAPFGSVRHLPRPWTFNETFLYNYDMKFQLYSLQAP